MEKIIGGSIIVDLRLGCSMIKKMGIFVVRVNFLRVFKDWLIVLICVCVRMFVVIKSIVILDVLEG